MQSTEWLRRLVTGSPFFGAIERPITGLALQSTPIMAWDSVIRSDCNHCISLESRSHFWASPTA
jgi:hypothetical protein